jgi:hypothetical protein
LVPPLHGTVSSSFGGGFHGDRRAQPGMAVLRDRRVCRPAGLVRMAGKRRGEILWRWSVRAHPLQKAQRVGHPQVQLVRGFNCDRRAQPGMAVLQDRRVCRPAGLVRMAGKRRGEILWRWSVRAHPLRKAQRVGHPQVQLVRGFHCDRRAQPLLRNSSGQALRASGQARMGV